MSSLLKRGWSLGLLACLIAVAGRAAAQQPTPVIIVLEASNAQSHDAVEDVLPFIAASQPVSLLTTCGAGTPQPTQDIGALRAVLAQPGCDADDPAAALQAAVTQMGSQAGSVFYLPDQSSIVANADALQTAVQALRTQKSCLYILALDESNTSDTTSRDGVRDMVSSAGCGTAYNAQTSTQTRTLLEAYLASQHRTLLTKTAAQIPLFSRASAMLSQPVIVADNMPALRVDLVWGQGDVDVALEPPPDAEAVPNVSEGSGYQSLTVINPAAGPWTIRLSVTQVPDNQVAVVLFSQSGQTEALSQPLPETTPETEAASTAPIATDPQKLPDGPKQSPPDPEFPLLPVLILGVVIGMIGLGLAAVWQRRSSLPDPDEGNTFHSRTTSELDAVPETPGSPSPYQKTEVMRVTVSEPLFRQFPARLVFISGPHRGQAAEIDSAFFTIGRHSSSRLKIQDATISRDHARIIFDESQNLYVIESVGQLGTQVNGRYIAQRQPLYNGDVIQMGATQVQFLLRLPG